MSRVPHVGNLAPEQESPTSSCDKEWLAISLAIERTIWRRFENAVRECYRYARLKRDVPIIRVSSPIVGAFATPIAANALALRRTPTHSEADSSIRATLDPAVRLAVDVAVQSVLASATYSIAGPATSSSVGWAIGSTAYPTVDPAVGTAIRSGVALAIRLAIDSAVRATGGRIAGSTMFGHYQLGEDLRACGPYTRLNSTLDGLEHLDKNKITAALAITSSEPGYWWPNRDFIMVCNPPTKISRDSRERLHCEDAHAVEWDDGQGLFMWHGVAVPGKLIMDPAAITRQDILSETNSEVSRVYAERLGWEKYFKLADVIRINAWRDTGTGLHYELYDFRKRRDKGLPRLLKMESPQVLDGTSPVYIEPVDPQIETAQAARRWQFMKEDGTWPNARECNKSPGLVFGWEA